MAKRVPKQLREILSNVIQDVEDAVDFVNEEFDEDFEKGDRYFNGEVDIPHAAGRSGVVYTMVRDSIRNIRPSIMRVLASNRKKLVKYFPSNLHVADALEQQEAYVHQLFWRSGGYQVLYDMVDESLKHRIGPVKTYFVENPAPNYTKLTMITADELQMLDEMPDVELIGLTQVSPPVGMDELAPDMEFFNVECVTESANGQIFMEAVPYGEFFISRNARSITDARVHGHQRSVTVSEAVEMGLDHDDWESLDDDDPETTQHADVAEARRRYQPRDEDERGDVMSHKFLLSETYIKADLEHLGYDQLYCLWFGGTSYELLDYERIEESPFDVGRHDPRSFTIFGTSISDITIQGQDVITSMLRGMVDNVHLANTPRLGGNPSQVNFDDLLNHKFGHPIRFKGQGTTVQVIQVPSQIQGTLPMLQWMETDATNKVGVTKAAQGLDPNAMQSTDKQAVQNTIQLSQGQVELAVRNLIETAVIPMFRKLLRLSIQHLDRMQITKMRGKFVSVDQMRFDPNLYAEPLVGLGTATDEQRMVGLQATLQQQTALMDKYGPSNPFVSGTQIYNTIEDITEMYGLYNVSRYFNQVTPEVEAKYAEQKKQEAIEMEKLKKPAKDPGTALVESEQIKAQTEKLKTLAKMRSDSANSQLKALELDAKDDLDRDKMAQDRILAVAELLSKGIVVDEQGIRMEQEALRTRPSEQLTGDTGAKPTGGERPALPAAIVPTGGETEEEVIDG